MTASVICLCGARAKEISSKKKKGDHGKFMNISAGIDCGNQQTKEGELKGRRELLDLIQSSGAVYIMDYWTWRVKWLTQTCMIACTCGGHYSS